MRKAPIRWSVPLFVAAASLACGLLLLQHLRLSDLLLDSATGTFAGLAALIVGGRLALGSPTWRDRVLQQAALVLLFLACMGEFFEPFVDIAGRRIGIDNIDDILLLAAAPVTLRLTARLDPAPHLAQRWLIVGFILQIAATVFDGFRDLHQPLFGMSLDAAHSTGDLLQLLATLGYLIAVSLLVIDSPPREPE
ncbi:MAG TPA: hypothetical protein VGF43_09450 [Dongiaceae bacterium]|jgi:hypothetical protein